jgi:hypothetical protein
MTKIKKSINIIRLTDIGTKYHLVSIKKKYMQGKIKPIKTLTTFFMIS